MHTIPILSLFALVSSTASLSFAARPDYVPSSSLLLLAYPYLVPALPLLVIGGSDQTNPCEAHHQRKNDTTTALTNSNGSIKRTDGHNHTLQGHAGVENGTETENQKHHHNYTGTANGAQPSPPNAVLTTENEGGDSGNATTPQLHHHHHNCSETAAQAEPSGSNALLTSGEKGAEAGNSSSHGHHHRLNCSVAVVTQTVLPLPFTSASG